MVFEVLDLINFDSDVIKFQSYLRWIWYLKCGNLR